METIGKKIKELRKEHNLTQKQLSKALNVSQSSISEWEKNTYEPTATAIKIIAIYFKVSADYLLGLEDESGAKIENLKQINNSFNNFNNNNGNFTIK